MEKYAKTLSEIIRTYNSVLKVVDQEAKDSETRAYGGMIRSIKGKLQEYITHSLIIIAWKEISRDMSRLEINKKKIVIPINPSYLEKIDNEKVKKHIKENIQNYSYKLSVDKHVYIDGKFVIGIECKAYAENAMIKRILIDFDLLLTRHKISCHLFQLESQLGGDYSQLNDVVYGSMPTHSIMSYFNCKLNIITLLKGDRKINSPIHKQFKPLDKKVLEKAKEFLKKGFKSISFIIRSLKSIEIETQKKKR